MKEELLEQIRCAQNEVTGAEGDLAKLLGEMPGGLRADKTTISEALRKAFHKLRAAREHLVTLEALARRGQY
jgi:hypothetical protein